MDLERAAGAAMPLIPVLVALDARLRRDEKVRMRGGTNC